MYITARNLMDVDCARDTTFLIIMIPARNDIYHPQGKHIAYCYNAVFLFFVQRTAISNGATLIPAIADLTFSNRYNRQIMSWQSEEIFPSLTPTADGMIQHTLTQTSSALVRFTEPQSLARPVAFGLQVLVTLCVSSTTICAQLSLLTACILSFCHLDARNAHALLSSLAT